MSTGKDQYVTRLMKAKCSCGSMSNYLNIPKDHGVIFSSPDSPILNANDHEPDKNIVHFGRCNSSKNPTNQLDDALSVLGIFCPGIIGSKMLKKLMGCEGCKCKPKTITPWNNVKDGYSTDGAPAITTESTLTCYYGGTIEIEIEQPAEGEQPQDTEQTVEEKSYNALNKMPPGMADKIADYCDMEYEAKQAENFTNDTDAAMAAGLDFMADSMAALCVPQEISEANYLHNMQQTIPAEALDMSGNIISQDMLGNFKMGNVTVAEMGCGCVSTYNALNIMGERPQLPGIIRYFESRPQLSEVAPGGSAGTSLLGISGYLTEQGHDVSFSLCEGSVGEEIKKSDVNIIGNMSMKNESKRPFGHFVTFEKAGADSFRFFNDIPGKKEDVRTMGEFVGTGKALHVVASVSKGKKKGKAKAKEFGQAIAVAGKVEKRAKK